MMTLDEMETSCGDGKGTVAFKLPRESSNGYSIRLTAYSGPVGQVMCGRDGYTVARFNCEAVLKWVRRQRDRQ